MSAIDERSVTTEPRQEPVAPRRARLWFVLLGVALVVIGVIALWSPVIASLATVVTIGVLLLAGGAAEAVGAFGSHSWRGFFLHLLSGLLSVVVGLLFLWTPVDAMLALTLFLACLLMAGGVLKVVAALGDWFGARGLLLVSGTIDLVLGMLIWLEWPASGLWVLGLFVGISLVFRGLNWIALGLAGRGR